LTITDADNGCTAVDTVVITEDATLPVITNISPTNPTLASCPILDNGSITITATGFNLEYSIDNGANFQASDVFNGLIAGTYNIVVRNTITTCSVTYATSVVLTAPNCVADLIVTKIQTGGANPVNVIGQTLDYTITLENAGTLDITNVNITDVLPDGNNGVLVGPTGDNGTVGILEIGETWTYTSSYITSLIDFTNAVDLVNTVSVTATEITTPEVDTAITTIVVSDLELTKTVSNNSPIVGENVEFTISVTNQGSSDATGIEVTDLLPDGYTFVSDDASGNYDSNTGIWNVGNILNGGNSKLIITATVNAGGDYTNIAEITASDNLDSDSTVNNNDTNEDDQDSAAVSPSASSDISLSKSVDNGIPNVGDDVVFTITVTNHGPSDATGIEVTDLLPDGYLFVSDDASGNYDSNTGIWTVGNILNGGNLELKITATVNAGGDYTNIAEVTAADNFDPNSNPGNGDPTENDYARECRIYNHSDKSWPE